MNYRPARDGVVSSMSIFSHQIFALMVMVIVAPNFVLAQGPTSTTSVETQEAASWYQSDWVTGPGYDSGDFVVGPGRFEIEIKPGETVTKEIMVTNRISEGRTFELFVEDVTAGESGSAVKLLGSERGPYTLKDYISFPKTQFTLGLGERARIPVTISIPADAEPGGRYGSVLITTLRDDRGDDDEGAPSARSPIIARIGTLFFITVPGDMERSGRTTGLTLIDKKWWYESGPIKFAVAYENTGSIHLNPYGELRVRNMFGEEVGFSQLEPWFVMPKALRSREVIWDREFLLGRYTATVLVNRGYEDIVDEQTVVFWVLPWKIVGGAFLGLFVLFFISRLFFRTFEFKRKQS